MDSSRSVWWLVGAIVSVVVIMVAHYWTDVSAVSLHNVYRRLSYIPILIAAFAYGVRGGVLTALAACIAYTPHAFFSHHRDPSPTVDKVFEMALYLVVGAMTGWLVDRRQQVRRALENSLEERDALEQQLVRAGKMSALGHMAAGLAHEIRNPLASIMGSAEAIATEFDASHRKHHLVELLLSEIDRLNRVVGDFVQFARPTPPERSRIDLPNLARDVVELTRAEAAKREVEVSVRANGPAGVEADADQIRQVLLNLLLNAYQAFDTLDAADGRERRVEIGFGRRAVAGVAYAVVTVSDSGPGIPPDQAESVFDPYFSSRPDGSGLGLTVSNRIVEAHGGFMEIGERAPGTDLRFYLPTGAPRDERSNPAG